MSNGVKEKLGKIFDGIVKMKAAKYGSGGGTETRRHEKMSRIRLWITIW